MDCDATIVGRERARRQCFAEDLKFTLTFGTSFSMTCPGDKCPMPASMSGVDGRVAAACSTYDRAGYVISGTASIAAATARTTWIRRELLDPLDARLTRAGYTATSHHLTSSGTEQSAPDRARLSAHLRKDGATVLGLGTWTVDARKTASGWRIVEETLESPLRSVIPKAE